MKLSQLVAWGLSAEEIGAAFRIRLRDMPNLREVVQITRLQLHLSLRHHGYARVIYPHGGPSTRSPAGASN
jgi:hypothetical protein